jgi:hypothetical protein
LQKSPLLSKQTFKIEIFSAHPSNIELSPASLIQNNLVWVN